MKKTAWIWIVIVVIVLVVGGYFIFHKSNKTSTSTTTSTAPAVNNSVILTKTNSSVGQYLTDPSGKALYTYNADTSGVSNCTGSCLTAWPAYTASASIANLPTGISTIKRSDNGQTQYTYNGMPLYYFASDTGTSVTGNGVQNFSVAKPAAATSTQSSTPSSSSSTSNSSSSSSNSSGYSY